MSIERTSKMEIPGFYPEDYLALEALALHAKRKTRNSYRKLENGKYELVKKPTSNRTPHDNFMAALNEIDHDQLAFKQTPSQLKNLFNLVNGTAQSVIETLHEELDIQQYKLVGHSSGSSVLEAQRADDTSHILKLAFAGFTKGTGRDNYRSKAPHMLQATSYELGNPALNLQAMPLVYTFEHQNPAGGYAFVKLINQLYEGTCYETAPSVNPDPFVFPDGSIGFIDPANLKYKEDYFTLNEQQQKKIELSAETLVKKRLKEWKIIDQFNPWDENGQLKQDRFFSRQKELSYVPEAS
ncbi:MAG: hypothetical protein KDJ35_00480 [Alphaproteobacteria bacterium]|nr:hypothetical protein [Alphaproteobacteria bacterium]